MSEALADFNIRDGLDPAIIQKLNNNFHYLLRLLGNSELSERIGADAIDITGATIIDSGRLSEAYLDSTYDPLGAADQARQDAIAAAAASAAKLYLPLAGGTLFGDLEFNEKDWHKIKLSSGGADLFSAIYDPDTKAAYDLQGHSIGTVDIQAALVQDSWVTTYTFGTAGNPVASFTMPGATTVQPGDNAISSITIGGNTYLGGNANVVLVMDPVGNDAQITVGGDATFKGLTVSGDSALQDVTRHGEFSLPVYKFSTTPSIPDVPSTPSVVICPSDEKVWLVYNPGMVVH